VFRTYSFLGLGVFGFLRFLRVKRFLRFFRVYGLGLRILFFCVFLGLGFKIFKDVVFRVKGIVVVLNVF